MMVKAFVFCI